MGLLSNKNWLEQIFDQVTANSLFFTFSKNWKSMKMFCKNLCDKVAKIRNLRWLLWYNPFFRWTYFSSRKTQNKLVSFEFLKKYWKSMEMFCKNLCDKVSKMKNLRLLSSSFFRADRHGVFCFHCRCNFLGENCKTNLPVFTFFENLWNYFEKIYFLKPLFEFFFLLEVVA